MWQKAATNFEAREFVQIGIGQDRRELQNLVERGICSSGFCVVEDEAHSLRPSEAENENDLIFLYVRRVRNNLFHGGKFNGRFFDPERSRELLEHSITILMAGIIASLTMLEAYEQRSD